MQIFCKKFSKPQSHRICTKLLNTGSISDDHLSCPGSYPRLAQGPRNFIFFYDVRFWCLNCVSIRLSAQTSIFWWAKGLLSGSSPSLILALVACCHFLAFLMDFSSFSSDPTVGKDLSGAKVARGAISVISSFPSLYRILSQILFKTELIGVSGASWLRRPIRQILSKGFKSFRNPSQNGLFRSRGRFQALTADPPDPFQRLQILYKSFTKLSFSESLKLHGSGGRSTRSFPKASNPFRNPSQNGSIRSRGRLKALEAVSLDPFQSLYY